MYALPGVQLGDLDVKAVSLRWGLSRRQLNEAAGKNARYDQDLVVAADFGVAVQRRS
jgi:hypothetical protein